MLSPVRLMSLAVGACLVQNSQYIEKRPIRSQNFRGRGTGVANQISEGVVTTPWTWHWLAWVACEALEITQFDSVGEKGRCAPRGTTDRACDLL